MLDYRITGDTLLLDTMGGLKGQKEMAEKEAKAISSLVTYYSKWYQPIHEDWTLTTESPVEGPTSQSFCGEIQFSNASLLQRYIQITEICSWRTKFIYFFHPQLLHPESTSPKPRASI